MHTFIFTYSLLIGVCQLFVIVLPVLVIINNNNNNNNTDNTAECFDNSWHAVAQMLRWQIDCHFNNTTLSSTLSMDTRRAWCITKISSAKFHISSVISVLPTVIISLWAMLLLVHWRNFSCGEFCMKLMLADDILLLAPTITALQKLLHDCERELDLIDMAMFVFTYWSAFWRCVCQYS